MNGRIVIAAYRPKKGKEAALENIVKRHVHVLRAEGLATNRAPVIMRATDGCILEVFEWSSGDAIQQAHQDTNVLMLWDEFSQLCEFDKPSSIQEFNKIFPEFDPL